LITRKVQNHRTESRGRSMRGERREKKVSWAHFRSKWPILSFCQLLDLPLFVVTRLRAFPAVSVCSCLGNCCCLRCLRVSVCECLLQQNASRHENPGDSQLSPSLTCDRIELLRLCQSVLSVLSLLSLWLFDFRCFHFPCCFLPPPI
jgi:hypothetical protein